MHKKVSLLIVLIVLVLLTPFSYCYLNTTKENNLYSNKYDTTTSNLESNNLVNNYYLNNETNYELVIEDDADLLTESEEKKLYGNMLNLTKYGNIIFKSINKNTYYSTDEYAKSFYNNRYGSKSGTVFLIDMSKRKIYVFSNGGNYNIITNSKAETITDNIYKLATKKEYYECAKQAFEQINTLLEGGKIAEPMKYISNIVIALMISLLINFAIFKIATKNRKASNSELIKECEKMLEHTEPEVNKTGSHRVYSPIDHGSSGGGGGGGRWPVDGGGGRRRWRRP